MGTAVGPSHPSTCPVFAFFFLSQEVGSLFQTSLADRAGPYLHHALPHPVRTGKQMSLGL